MQERRTAIRIPARGRARYRVSDDFLPQEGRMTNVSERGMRLLARESHTIGERVGVDVDLPGEEKSLSATGVVRWTAPRSRWGWYPLGVEWLPLEDPARQRLHALLEVRPPAQVAAPGPATTEAPPQTPVRWTLLAAIVSTCFIAGLLGWWLIQLGQENRRLYAAMQQRAALIHQMTQRSQALEQELRTVKTQFATTVGEVVRLDQQTQHLEGHMVQLTQDVERVQRTNAEMRQQREALMQRVLELEQERLQLQKKLSSIPELRVAIRDAINARREAQRTQRRLQRQALREAQHAQAQAGNGGYLLRDGRPTINRSTIWIRVHDPAESLLSP